MNIKLREVGVAVFATVIAQAAMANSGKVDFTGAITATTCEVSVNGDGNNPAVSLPVVSSGLLQNEGDVAGRTALTFMLSNCTLAGGMTKASVYFVSGDSINTSGRLDNMETVSQATNVDLQLLDVDHQPINLAAEAGAQGPAAVSVDVDDDSGEGKASLRHFVQYYANGPVTAGGVKSDVEYEINYE